MCVCVSNKIFYGTLSLEALQMNNFTEGDTPPHIGTQVDILLNIII